MVVQQAFNLKVPSSSLGHPTLEIFMSELNGLVKLDAKKVQKELNIRIDLLKTYCKNIDRNKVSNFMNLNKGKRNWFSKPMSWDEAMEYFDTFRSLSKAQPYKELFNINLMCKSSLELGDGYVLLDSYQVYSLYNSVDVFIKNHMGYAD